MAYLSTYRDFPFCFTDNPLIVTGQGTSYPVGFSYEEFFFLCYYGEFIFNANAETTYDTGNGYDVTRTVLGDLIYSPYRLLDVNSGTSSTLERISVIPQVLNHKEAGLACNFSVDGGGYTSIVIHKFTSSAYYETNGKSNLESSRSLGVINASSSSSGGHPDPSNVEGAIICRIQIDSTLYRDGKYYPFMQIGAGTSATQGIYTRDFNGVGDIVGHVVLLGHTVNLYNNGFTNWSGGFNFQTYRRWPYDPGDTDPYPGKDGSGPVYDSTTGTQLRNPFNIVKRGDGTFYNPNYTP